MNEQTPPEPSGSPTGAPAIGSAYTGQARGGASAYAAYYAGMDRSMQQKVALTTAFFPVHGVLADMGCGSGAGSYDLACLHDGLHVIGVDVAAESVAYARSRYQRPNLEYRIGDIADPIFPAGSVDGILNSSVWHHLTSFNGFALTQVRRCLANQTTALRPGGVLIVRDFVIPRGPAEVLLDVPEHDGAAAADGSDSSDSSDSSGSSDSSAPAAVRRIMGMSTAALLSHFAATWRSSQNPDGPLPLQRLGPVRPGWLRYRLSHRAAAEFVLHKDYRRDFAAECREEYTFWSQAEYEAALRDSGLRIIVSVELRNPWIVNKRFRGHFFLYDLHERPLPYPPTNYLIVGEKVGPGQGVHFDLALRPKPEPRFLRLQLYEHRETGKHYELAERPHPVIDLIPWFRLGEQIFIVGKQGFPRPLVGAGDSPNLDGASVAGYLTEPISAMSEDPDAGLPLVREVLRERAGVAPEQIAGHALSLRYFTSPGGLNERVTAQLVELSLPRGPSGEPELLRFPEQAPNYSQFSTAGRVRALPAAQLLRAAQVGGLLDARLELNTYQLLLRLGAPLGPWIGAEVTLRAQPAARGVLTSAQVALALQPPARAVFVARDISQRREPGFLAVHAVTVTERDGHGAALRTATLEACAPGPLGCSTLSVLPVLAAGGEIFVGLEARDLPAAQRFTGRSCFITNPAWRLPRSMENLDQVEAQIAYSLLANFSTRALRSWPLGGKYYPATGATPEVVYPLAVEVDADSIKDSSLQFIPLRELVAQRALVEDGHLLIAMFRLAHALAVIT